MRPHIHPRIFSRALIDRIPNDFFASAEVKADSPSRTYPVVRYPVEWQR